MSQLNNDASADLGLSGYMVDVKDDECFEPMTYEKLIKMQQLSQIENDMSTETTVPAKTRTGKKVVKNKSLRVNSASSETPREKQIINKQYKVNPAKPAS